MKLILDTANLGDISYFNEFYPIVGVTTNPTILAREGGDVVDLLKKIRDTIGNKELHVQVIGRSCDVMVDEAHAILSLLGENTYIKIPVTDEGIKAIMQLTNAGCKVTATAILTPTQAMIASNAGASYVAPYVGRIEKICGDGISLVAEIQEILNASDRDTEVLAASFKTARQVLDVALAGVGAATVSSEIMRTLLSHPITETSVSGFESDWKRTFGDFTFKDLIGK